MLSILCTLLTLSLLLNAGLWHKLKENERTFHYIYNGIFTSIIYSVRQGINESFDFLLESTQKKQVMEKMLSVLETTPPPFPSITYEEAVRQVALVGVSEYIAAIFKTAKKTAKEYQSNHSSKNY